MISRVAIVAASLVCLASAGPCKPVVPTLPTVGNPAASELPTPTSGLTLKKIAVGHGIQNYSCATADAATAIQTTGALAVLYDVTSLYPGTPNSGLDQSDWDVLTTTVLFGQNIPLNLVNTSAAAPGTIEAPNALPESAYIADTANPFPEKSDLAILGKTVPFLGHHYFDINNIPTFDLSTANLLASVGKINQTNAPDGANKGIIGTGAVAWLLLDDKGTSRGIKNVYRVITAGGVPQTCGVAGAGPGSVPYTAFYWFFG